MTAGSTTARRSYLDHASTSPLRPAAYEAMLPYLREHHADPGRVHQEGQRTRVAIEGAREQVASLVKARPREVVFTSGGTEACNTAIFGGLERFRAAEDPDRARPHLVTTAVEHSAVLEACDRSGAEVETVEVDRTGRFDPAAVVGAMRPATALVSVQLANHEVATRQDVEPIVSQCRDRGVLVHVDACAAVGFESLDFAGLGADLCSITGHKFGAPPGVGALLVRRGLRLPPFLVGGAQERARRAGIENVPGIVGFGEAAQEVTESLDADAKRMRVLTDRAVDGLLAIEGVEQYGDPDRRLPHIICLGVDGVEAEPVLLGLDQRGVAVHSGSSCASETLEPSSVLEAMGVDTEHSIRVSVGWSTTDTDVDRLLDAFPDVVAKLRALR